MICLARFRGLGLMCFVLSLLALQSQVFAASKRMIIRDLEIESALYAWSAPLFKAAQLDPKSVRIVLVQSDEMNAFVAGGANIFIYTGLIEATETPGELLGVIAHEIGHITGAHLVHGQQAWQRASYESILGTVLGIGAAILSGDGRLGSAIALGSQQAAVRGYLSHSRTHESSADQAALSLLEASGLSARGLLTFLKRLEHQELRPSHQQDEYMRTHPVTDKRIETLRTSVQSAASYRVAWPDAWMEQHRRMKAKISSFLKPAHVSWVYSDRDTRFAAQYARAIAAYRLSDVDTALAGIDALLVREPDNPYLHELKGQVLVDFGRIAEALPALRRAVALAPEAGGLYIALGHAVMEHANDVSWDGGRGALLDKAISHLHVALQTEAKSVRLHRLLATAYGRKGEKDLAALHLAEEAVLQGRYEVAHKRATGIVASAKSGSSLAIKAQDIVTFVQHKLRDRK